MKETKKERATRSAALQTLREVRGCLALLTLWLVVTLKAAGALVLNNASIGQYANGDVTDVPSLIGLTISNRWMATHFTNLATTVSDWVDETNGFHWTLLGSSSQLTNSAQGIYLDATHCLVGTNTMKDTALVTFFIYDFAYTGNDPGNHILFQDSGRGLGFGWNMSGSQQPYHWVIDFQPQLTNVMNNIICFGNVDGADKVYTNGVLSTSAATLYAMSGNCNIGAVSFNNNGFNGWLKEVIIFTATSITSSQISNLNYYATHYPY